MFDVEMGVLLVVMLGSEKNVVVVGCVDVFLGMMVKWMVLLFLIWKLDMVIFGSWFFS